MDASSVCRFESLETRRLFSTGPLLYSSDGSGRLFTVDVGTGAVHVIGTMPTVMYDLAFDKSGNLYGVDGASTLYRINATNASTTTVGSVGAFVNALVFSPSGTLYGAGSALYRINPSTGAGTKVGSFNSGVSSAGDLAFDASGNLFLSTNSNTLVKVNPATAATTLVGSLGFDQVFGLAYGPNNVMYGLSNNQEDVFSINLATGHGTLTASFNGKGVDGAYGSTFFGEAARPSIDVRGNNVSIPINEASPTSTNGTSFGSVNVSSGSVSHTFTVVDTGSGALSLSGTPHVTIGGANPGDFTVVTQPAGSVSPGGSTSFVIKFDPTAAGLRTAEVSIADNVGGKNPFRFEVSGTGTTSSTDKTPPTVTAVSAPTVKDCVTSYTFTVTYSDNVGVKISTLGTGDVKVTGPNGFSQLATLVSVNNTSNGTPRTATYRITAPHGMFLHADNGTYTLTLQANQVSDTSGNFAASKVIGSFVVSTLDQSAALDSTGKLSVYGTCLSDNISLTESGGIVTVKINSYSTTFSESKIKSLLIYGDGGNDVIYVGPGVCVGG